MRSITKDEAKIVMLNILRDFHRYCEKENLRYSLDGGTLLGAMRHKGYIPWDDDIDVLMPRADYERLFEHFDSSEHPDYLRLRDYRTDSGYLYPFVKLADARTKLGTPGKEQMNIGLHIDIFPLDGMPGSEWGARVFMRLQQLLRNVTTCAGLHLRVKGRSLPKQLFLLGFKMCTLWAPSSFWNRLMNGLGKRYLWSESRWAANVLWFPHPRLRIPSHCFEGSQKIEFEHEMFNAIGDPHGYLTGLYGDYMTPPPPDKRPQVHMDESNTYVDDSYRF